jgi:hypothetical protein
MVESERVITKSAEEPNCGGILALLGPEKMKFFRKLLKRLKVRAPRRHYRQAEALWRGQARDAARGGAPPESLSQQPV